MNFILGLLSFLLFIAFIVGMVKPSIVIGWIKNPNRWKVFGLWLVGTIIIGSLMSSDEELEVNRINSLTSEELIQDARINSDTGNFSKALQLLGGIDSSDENYLQSKELYTEFAEAKNARDAKIREDKIIEERQSKIDQLKREISSIDDGIDFSQYRGTVEQLQIELVLFRVWGSLANDNENSSDKEISALAIKLKSKVQRIQIKEFPILRKAYSKLVASKLWEQDIYVRSGGKGNRVINFSGGLFAANTNKKQFQNTVRDILNQFRFTQSRYRWYKEADEYTYYTIYEGKDSELILD